MNRLVISFVTVVLLTHGGEAHSARRQCTQFFDTEFKSAHSTLAIQKFISIVRKVAEAQPQLAWPSSELKPIKPINRERVSEIWQLIANADSQLLQEVRRQVLFPRFISESLWEKYFAHGSYDKVVGLNPAHIGIILLEHKALVARSVMPPELIAIFGAGPGDEAVLLGELDQRRKFVLYDNSPMGCEIAAQKMAAAGMSKRAEIKQMDLHFIKETEKYDAGLMTNVSYSLRDAESVLYRIFLSLKPGALLLINEPNEFLMKSQEALLNYGERYLLDTYDSGSPATEFDYAKVAAINYLSLIGGRRYLSTDQFKGLLTRIGFVVEEVITTQYSAGTLYRVRRPL